MACPCCIELYATATKKNYICNPDDSLLFFLCFFHVRFLTPLVKEGATSKVKSESVKHNCLDWCDLTS